jgi:hypothetical protein
MTMLSPRTVWWWYGLLSGVSLSTSFEAIIEDGHGSAFSPGAVPAVVAVDWVAGVALVGIHFQFTLGELEGVLRNDLVGGEFATAHDFAGSAVTQDVLLGLDVGGPVG